MRKNILSKTLCLAAAIAIFAGNTVAASSGGVFWDKAYAAESSISLPEPAPISASAGGGSTFAGWYLTPDFTGTKYMPGDKITVDDTLLKDNNVDLYAKWSDYTVKYAVCLWGINQDKGENGETLGLTFGSATGASYINTYKACSGTSAEDPGNCLHWMTWSQIIDISKTDPTIFQKCLKNGCTHSVELNITGELAEGAKSYSGGMDDGDGAGFLYDSIADNYRKWNNKLSNAGGWPSSRMRATFNGSDGQTDPSVAGDDCLDEDNCLLAMFPKELRDEIVPKAAKSDIVYNKFDAANNKTTYDKLWLFSGHEIRKYEGTDATGSNDVRPLEGELYQRSENLDITTSAYGDLKNYMEDGSAWTWWLRSSRRSNSNHVCLVYSDGNWVSDYVTYDSNGVAPGFCLPGPARLEPYTVKYAVCLWGINQDKGESGETLGLTFGPATGTSYIHTFKQHSAGKDCLHNMTWAEIIAQSQKNPHYFDTCLLEGCTHSVNLNITGSLKGENYSGQMDDGDGAGILYDSISSDYRKWNNTNSNSGGWPASRIRATLNGKDNQTDPSVAGDDCLTADICLFAMFPEDLQKGIAAKAVKSDTVYDDLSGNNTTTYDKLWLFSGKEVYGGGSSDNVIRPNEGELYQRSKNFGITTSACSSLMNYMESGSASYWWLRSVYRYDSNRVFVVSSGGNWSYVSANYTSDGFAPGFCLK